MNSFIEDVLIDLTNQGEDLSNCIFILPSKRAGTFLKHHLKNHISFTSFAPEILSIEEFIEKCSGLSVISGVELLFQFYGVYQQITPKDKTQSFELFSKWAQTLIQDYNEIDRYSVEPNQIFNYLEQIQTLNHWSFENEKTELISNYLEFWRHVKTYYNVLTTSLLSKKIAYQGLLYKTASQNIHYYSKSTQKQHVFMGFNALNTCEELIINHLLEAKKGVIYWDNDSHFFSDYSHSAGLFARRHKKDWNYFKNNPYKWVNSNFKTAKDIKVIGCPKSIGQSKYVGQLLNNISAYNPNFKNTAVVLGDEILLSPILNALPKSVKSVNVTMGLPLATIPLHTLFERLFSIHKQNNKRFYYKDVIAILSNPMIQNLFEDNSKIIRVIEDQNYAYIALQEILNISNTDDQTLITLLFEDWNSSVSKTITNCIKLIKLIQDQLNALGTKKHLELEYLFRFYKLFNEIETLNLKYNYITDTKTLHAIYKELLNSETLDFQGEPLEGLQIMGMLESRVLDFETVIITSVNEGVLPGGKTNNSFIPYDVKVENGLPTYKEKDAVYTYHFYNLIQRAKTIYLVYNTEIDTLKGGEKSRFITQLEVDNSHHIEHIIASPQTPVIEKQLITVKKDENVLELLKNVSEKGFSPSSLTNYIRNPIDFYFEKILKVKETEAVEETIAANTLGTVIHNTLEDFYKPFEGNNLTTEDLQQMKSSIATTVKNHFNAIFKGGDTSKGKNLIIYEVAKRYVYNFIESEIDLLKKGNTLKIIAIEIDNSVTISIPELDFPIRLKGKVDRVDELNGTTRIIDYKSGKVEQNNVEIIDWNDLNTDYKKYSKSFQVLCYAYMMHKQNDINLPVEAGIISFKNLKQGFLKFAKKEAVRSRNKNTIVSEETLQQFENQLKALILDICNPEIDFIENKLD